MDKNEFFSKVEILKSMIKVKKTFDSKLEEVINIAEKKWSDTVYQIYLDYELQNILIFHNKNDDIKIAGITSFDIRTRKIIYNILDSEGVNKILEYYIDKSESYEEKLKNKLKLKI